ncbi:MAG: lytic transglycosylase domain-containing protein [Clostridia bacterium]|nr:lytic transglycosylase domain-containing protein [Clostridia bacterium]
MKKLLTLVIVLLLLAILSAVLVPRIYNAVQTQLYPLPDKYRPTVEKYAEEYNIPIEILCAIINTESSFDPNATSHAGAMGMMQITSDTFEWLQFRSGEHHNTEDLYDYDTNIKYGAYFLSLLYEEFGDWDTVFAAYNAGRGRVNGWLADERYSKDGKLTDIPIKETANYIKKVNNAIKKYQKLYFSFNTTE